MRKLISRMLLLLVILFLTVSCTPAKVISGNTVVNCNWPVAPVPTYTADKATVAQLINDLLEDKNNFCDYLLKVQSVKKCYDESLGK